MICGVLLGLPNIATVSARNQKFSQLLRCVRMPTRLRTRQQLFSLSTRASVNGGPERRSLLGTDSNTVSATASNQLVGESS